jgi:hypothetical protein
MNTRSLLVAAFLVPLLCAQDDKGKAAMPNPKTKQHEVLAALAGDWTCTCKMAAMPGVPGMEQAKEWTGTEKGELICNGLWLKSSIDSKCKDETFRGVWLAGFDPLKNKYVGVFVTSHDEPSSVMDGTYDEATKTWTFSGKSPMGDFRSQLVFKDKDTSVETCFMKGTDGKESECMQITRTRSKGGAVAKDATAKATDISGKQPAIATSRESTLIADGIGKWDCVVAMKAPGQPASEEKCTENVVAICDGKWAWSDFKGNMMGMPFEGHAIFGYEPATKQFVSYWIDSMSPQVTRTSGTFDAAQKVGTFTGECCDEKGKPMKIQQTLTIKDKNTRQFDMTCTAADGAHEMKITYKRAGN